MKLINDELKTRFAEVGDQSELDNPIVVAKFFNPCGSQTWYATEYDTERNVCVGYVTGMGFDEWGTFSIDELESLQLPFGLTIERDLYIKEIPFYEMMKKEGHSIDEPIQAQDTEVVFIHNEEDSRKEITDTKDTNTTYLHTLDENRYNDWDFTGR